jgi:hypothetical protein
MDARSSLSRLPLRLGLARRAGGRAGEATRSVHWRPSATKRLIYVLLPISIWIWALLKLIPSDVPNWSAKCLTQTFGIPAAVSSSASNWVTSCSPQYLHVVVCTPTATSSNGNPTPTNMSLYLSRCDLEPQGHPFHLAFSSAEWMDSKSLIISGSFALIAASYRMSGNCRSFSAMRSICSSVSFRGAARASASIAFCFASEARSFERRCNLSPAAPALRPERSAPYTPAAIAKLAIVYESFSVADLPQPKIHRRAASKINAAMMSHSHQPSARACLARSAQSLSSLSVVLGFLLIKRYPYYSPRRYRDRQFWIGVGLWVAFALLMFNLLFCFRPHP